MRPRERRHRKVCDNDIMFRYDFRWLLGSYTATKLFIMSRYSPLPNQIVSEPLSNTATQFCTVGRQQELFIEVGLISYAAWVGFD